MPPRLGAQQAPVEAAEITRLKAELQTLSRTRATQDVSGRYSRLHSAATLAEDAKLDGSQQASVLALLAAAYGAVGRSIVGTAGANLRVWAFLGTKIRERCNSQLVLALLRSDTLSLIAQICSALGTADGGDAVGPSTSSSSAIPRSAQVVIVGQVSYMLYSIVGTTDGNQHAALSDLVTALGRSQLLEHLTGAILRLAAVLPPGVRGSGDPDAALVRLHSAGQEPSAAFDAEADWACLCLAVRAVCQSVVTLVYPNNLAVEFSSLAPVPHPVYVATDLEDVVHVSQLRSLLSGRCVQWFLVWALQAACLGAAAAAAPAAAAPGAAAAAAAGPGPSGPDAPQQEVPRILPLRLPPAPAALPAAGTPVAACALVETAVMLVWQMTVSGPGHLPIVQPPVGYRPAAAPVQHASGAAAAGAGATAAATSANAGAGGSGRAVSHGVPNNAVAVYDLIKADWPGFYGMGSGVSGTGDGGGAGDGTRVYMSAAAPLLCRLVTELLPRQAAARLPGLWREVLVPGVCNHATGFHGPRVGELLRLQVPALPLAAGAPPPSAGASSYSTYSLRCALDAGLLPALERALRNEQAWAIGVPHVSDLSNGPGRASSTGPQPGVGNAFHMLREINGSLRNSGLWPAALARAPPEQVVGLVATLTAAARRLSQRPPVLLGVGPLVGCLNKMMPCQEDAMGLLCGNLAALLEQGLDLAEDAASEGWAAMACAAREEATVSVAGAPAGSSGHSHRRRYLRLNDALEAPESAPMQWAWLVAAGGTPPAGSAAAAQRDWLLSFAALQWLPLLLEDLGATVHEIVKREERAADGKAVVLSAIGLETAVVVLRVAGEVLAAAALAQADAAETAQRVTDDASGSTGQAAAGMAGAGQAQQRQQHLESWRPFILGLVDGGYLRQLVGYMATHTEEWVGVSSSISNDSTGDGTRCGGADNADADAVSGAGLEGCVLDALEAFWAHRPMAVVGLMLVGAHDQGDCTSRLCDRSDSVGNTDSSCSNGSSSRSSSPAPAHQVVVDQDLWGLRPLREVAARHGRSELVQLMDAASADVAVALDMADAAVAGREASVGLPDVSFSQQVKQLQLRLRRRYGGAAEGGGGADGADYGATGRHLRRAWRLLSPYEVRQQVEAALATAAAAVVPAAATSSAGAASGSGGGGAASVAAAAAVAPAALCANPSCSSLDGPSALVPPRGGKTCSRCRAARYCCGLCQLQHWREGGHATQCPGVVAATAAAGSAVACGIAWIRS
ncbi:hypothetical protein CHLRE_09g401626v5 [Chlamydomonas reinhardtii]|uniref:phytol kinase n=1 Tax=Chlamydomonas reinhardtii TaxID=3055 RepID=A0A2K3DF34_CHLRE|nr:uncharacterized protein CHLRE_09g401626v5 [Chlamydomonas reinhardtii]PNW79127.1 hypothetical protein CHLRE_09g401626v5 [Chlamydomonas reinhardtii]